MGVCYYYEWDYKNACKILEGTISELAVLAPREQSVYYYCLAESCFMQNEYNKAIPYYEKATILCLDNEKPISYTGWHYAICTVSVMMLHMSISAAHLHIISISAFQRKKATHCSDQ